jgi:predicted phage terminase large subunit-like protein
MDTLSPWEAAARHFEPRESPWVTPGAMARDLDPTTVQTPALDLIDQALVDVAEGRLKRLAISLPPQEGKSQRVSRRFPLWLLSRNPDLRIVIASYELGVARRWGRDIRNDIATHTETLGFEVRHDTSAAHEWQLEGHLGGCYTVGIGGALTGRPSDLMVIDDPHKNRKDADSENQRNTVWDWWTDTARTRLSPEAPVVVIQTRWHEDDLTGRLIADSPGGWTVLNIPAQANHRPEKGQTDPLGRAPGDYLESTRGRQRPRPAGSCKRHPDWACCDWDDIKADVQDRTWEALYQGEPAPPTGSVFKRGWWSYYDQAQWIEHDNDTRTALGFDEIIQSWDLAFKDSDGSDFVAGQVWGRRGIDAYLLDQVHDRMDFVTTCEAIVDLSRRWPQAIAKLIEDKANGPAVINQLRRTVPGLIPIEPDGSKVARAAAVSPLVEAGNVHLPAKALAPWVEGLVQEATSFPTSPHDDRVDAMSQALNRLLINPLLFEDEIFEDDESEQSISLY